MWFIDISPSNINKFINWANDKTRVLRFGDELSFSQWILRYNEFPLSIYLDGVQYTFVTRKEAALFMAGFEAALSITGELSD